MKISETIILALKSLLTSKMRSLLTMLGIIIGVAAVIIITAVGNGMQNYVKEMFQSLGTNVLSVSITSKNTSRKVEVDDFYQFVDDNPAFFNNVSPNVGVGAVVKVGSEFLDSTGIIGVSETFLDMKKYDLSAGRALTYFDAKDYKKVCLIGSYVNQEYFDGNGLGQTVKVNGDKFKIIGVLDQKAGNEERSDDDKVFIPYTTALKANKTNAVSMFSLELVDESTAVEAKKKTEHFLYDIYQDEDAYYVLSLSEVLGTMTQMLNVIVFVLAAIAAISLLVGGIGIMNITLVSVTERTREIGIRKALGAKRVHIMQQFIIEAATTSGIGGVIGIGLGLALSSLFTVIAQSVLNTTLTLIPTAQAILMAFGVSVTIGIVFGFLPARSAARLSPIDALRYE